MLFILRVNIVLLVTGCIEVLDNIVSTHFQGYCGYAFTVHDRFLLPANPDIGVLHHKGKYFAFSSKEAAGTFATNPDQ